MGFGDGYALFRSLQATYREHRSSPSRNLEDEQTTFAGSYDIARALRIYNETRRHFLNRVELQMTLDIQDAKYIAQAGVDEREWIRRFRERTSLNHWLTEHDVEIEFQRVLAAESLWSTPEIAVSSVV